MLRWAWRLFRWEWRQQLLIVVLIVVAVGATFVGAAVATDTPPSATADFGTAQDLATFQGPDPHLASQIASLEHRFGRVDVIENDLLTVPGTIDTFQLRAQNPTGPFGGPLLSLLSGRYPTGHHEVAMTPAVAAELGLKVGGVWHHDGTALRLVGTVENPQSLLDEFALVAPGQVRSPTQTTVLFDAGGVPAHSIGPNVETPASISNTNVFNPETIVFALATVGMLLIALVGVGGFTVLAQRRLRSFGMIESLGATDAHVRLVVRANGVVVGAIGAVVGAALGMVTWLAYRPTLESDAHHVVGVLALPWAVIVPSMALAVVATYVAASRPARSVTKIPVVTALSGRPAPPRQVHRSAVPGVVLAAIAFFLFGVASSRKSPAALVPGFILLIVSVVLLSPICLVLLARASRPAPIAVRLALRDLARYRARSASALAAISLGVLIAVTISVVAAGRYGNVLDYAGPNLASDQVVVHTVTTSVRTVRPGGPTAHPAATAATLHAEAKGAHAIAAALGSTEVVALESTSASLWHAAPGRNWSGQVFVATPQLLRAFGIAPSSVRPSADILTMRPGLATTSRMLLVYNGYMAKTGPAGGGGADAFACPKSTCLADPTIQEVGALPSGTSAPNTVITEHAVHLLGLTTTTTGWLIQTPAAPTAAQITASRAAAAQTGMTIETKNSAPSSTEIINWATVFGIALALGILAMSLGLIRSETAADLRTLAATGAGGRTRRTVTAATAGGLALLGAVLGTVAAYIAAAGFFRASPDTGISALGHVPVHTLALIVVGMPVAAAVVAWLLSGKEPPSLASQPIE
jgi:putative ABC transport system permease protein